MAGSTAVSIRGLRAFCVAARHGSFRQAGEELFITASAVSHQIRNLEEALGESLFDRSGRRLALSTTGTQLYGELGPLINEMDAVVARYRKHAGPRVIRISVQPFFASEYFIPRLPEFTSANPSLDIKVGTSDESWEKVPPDVDLAIRLLRAPPSDRHADPLFPLRLAPAGSPGFKQQLALRNNVIVSDFPLIVHEAYPASWQEWMAATGIRVPEGSRIIRLDSMIAMVRAAQRGLGAVLVPIPVGELWFGEGSIVRLFPQDLVAGVSYFLTGSPSSQGDEAVARFRQWILQTFATGG